MAPDHPAWLMLQPLNYSGHAIWLLLQLKPFSPKTTKPDSGLWLGA
jgi:hypothetical protein